MGGPMLRALLRILKVIAALVIIAFVTGASMAAIHGSFGPEWKSWAIITLNTMQKCVEVISDPAWLTEIVRDVFGNAWGLLASSGLAGALLGAWYWGEIHFPSRIIRLCNAIERDHRAATRGELLEVARQGLGRLPTNIAMSKLTFLRRMLTGWGGSKRQIAKSMAASIEYIAVEARALESVKSLADENQITALLGCHYEAQNNRDQAFTEYEVATKVVSDNIASRDWAAGCARRQQRSTEEKVLLEQIRKIAEDSSKKAVATGNAGDAVRYTVEWARGCRREAERLGTADLEQARDILASARDLLNPMIDGPEARLELGRVLTLYCEVQLAREERGRGGIGNLADREGNPIGDMTRMLEFVSNIEMHERPPERGGGAYGHERGTRISERICNRRRAHPNQ
jgi:hypothetical protein